MMRISGRVAIVAIAASLLSGSMAKAETFTLAEALALAYDTNPQLDAARAGLRATDENVAVANAGWRPQVSVGGSYGLEVVHQPSFFFSPSNTTDHPLTGQATLSETLYNGGRTYAEIMKAKAQVKAGVAQLTQTEETVLLSAVTAYEDVVRDAATLRLSQNNVSALEKQLQASQEGHTVGELTRTDVAQSRLRLAGAQSALVTAQAQLAISRSNFEHTIGRPAETLETLPALPALPSDEASALRIATKQNPLLLAAVADERVAEFAVDDALGALLPQVSVNGQYQYSKTLQSFGTVGTEHVLSVLGQVTLPIYQGGAEEATVRQAKQLRSQAETVRADTERQVTDAARTAWQSFLSAKTTIQSNKVQVAAAQEAYEGVHQEQLVGSRTVLDVLNAEQELLNAQLAVVVSQHNTYIAAYQLLAATGQLNAKYLALKAHLYNPKVYYDDNELRWFGLGD